MDPQSDDRMKATLTEIARLNDDAVYKWALLSTSDNETSYITGNLLLQAVDRVNSLSRVLLTTLSRREQCPSPVKEDQTTSFAVLPVDVDPPGVSTVCLNRAFLVKPIRTYENVLVHDICVVAAVVFYNYALYYHQQAELENDSGAMEVISKYYQIANSILEETAQQISHVKPVMWNFIAAVLYNFAECNRSPCYFGLLEAIMPNIRDAEDYVFFQRAIAMAKVQMCLLPLQSTWLPTTVRLWWTSPDECTHGQFTSVIVFILTTSVLSSLMLFLNLNRRRTFEKIMEIPSLSHHVETVPRGQSMPSTQPNQAMCSYRTARAMLMDVARTNDEAIFNWAISSSFSLHVKTQLIKNLDKIHHLSRLVHKVSPAHLVGCVSAARPSFMLPLTVRIDTSQVSSTFNKAFLLKASISGDASITDSLSLAAAVVFYNTALFFHMKSDTCVASINYPAEKYYQLSNGILGQYMERTRRPLWTLQAAVMYNLDIFMSHQTMVPSTSSVYFEQLRAIVGYIEDGEDMMFFKWAVALTLTQLKQCHCAAMA